MTNLFSTDPVFIAHRASCSYLPENTLESMKIMHQKGATYFEIDCYMMKDGNLAVIHDEKISRVTTGKGKITQLSKVDLIDVYVIGGDGGNKIPMLETLMKYTKDNDLRLMIEVKDKRQAIVDKIDLLIEKYGEKYFGIYSFHKKIIEAFAKKEKSNGFILQWNRKKLTNRAIEIAKNLGVGINLDGRFLTKSDIEKLKSLDKPIHVYTVNNREEAKKWASCGICGIITDTLFEGDGYE